MNTDKEAIDRLLELGGSIVTSPPMVSGSDPFTIIPSGCRVEDLVKYYPPQRIKIKLKLTDAESFTQYVNDFKTEATRLFADLDTGLFSAMLDYHTAATPSYCSHRAGLALTKTEEFANWMQRDRDKMSQVEFATWLEDMQGYLVNPSGAELLELITSLHGHVDARFNQTFRLKDGGCNLAYDEDVSVKGTSSSKAGEMELPDSITVGLSPFEGAPRYQIVARLKVRIENRKLVLWYETPNRNRIQRDAVGLVRQRIAAGTNLPVLLATGMEG